MRCAHCKSRDVDIAHVKECSGIRFTDDGIKPVTTDPVWPASDKQIAYVLGLQAERVLPTYWPPYDEATLKKMDKDEVSGLIVSLKSFPKQEKAKPYSREWKMPEGRYALFITNELNPAGVWRFYEVTKPGDGKWKGYTFVKMLIGAPGDYIKQSVAPGLRTSVLEMIEQDYKAAMLNYGLQSGVCGRCSSPLTDPVSLAAGIGPICAKKSGW